MKVQSGLTDRLTNREYVALQHFEDLPPVRGVSDQEIREARAMVQEIDNEGDRFDEETMMGVESDRAADDEDFDNDSLWYDENLDEDYDGEVEMAEPAPPRVSPFPEEVLPGREESTILDPEPDDLELVAAVEPAGGKEGSEGQSIPPLDDANLTDGEERTTPTPMADDWRTTVAGPATDEVDRIHGRPWEL